MMSALRRGQRRPFAALVSLAVMTGAIVAYAVLSGAVTGTVASAIEIDAPNTANLYPGGSTANCSAFPSSTLDWVKDCSANSDAATLVDSIATGVIVGQTGAVATGHWNGVRIVDGVAQGDQDIFLTGGKENDTTTWNVGPGSVGSSKYDMTQAYLANTTTDLFFGMERRGNNGTTAFDFEFNQVAPPGGVGTYVPTRTSGDVLLSFEMNGSGSSGSATAHYFTWSGSAYVEHALPAGTIASINDSTSTPGAPWGHVDSQGHWVTGNLDRFTFAEAKVPLSILPGVNACGGKAYVEVRTRSSVTDTSDLKDTSKIFEYDFPSISATTTKTAANGSTGVVTVSTSVTGAPSGSSVTYQWQKKTPAATTWTDVGIPSTSSTLTYSSFTADNTSPSTTSFTLGSDSYVGLVYTELLRAHVTAGSSGCSADSSAATVKKIVAVDP